MLNKNMDLVRDLISCYYFNQESLKRKNERKCKIANSKNYERNIT